jgi:hypothetical protein
MCRQKYAHQMHIARLKVNSRYAGSEAVEGEARSLKVMLSDSLISNLPHPNAVGETGLADGPGP